MASKASTQIKRLNNFLIDLHMTGEVCVFTRLSGHVDQFEVDVCASQKQYGNKLYSRQFYFYNENADKNYDMSYLKDTDWKELVDGIIEDIKDAIKNRAIKLKDLKDQE